MCVTCQPCVLAVKDQSFLTLKLFISPNLLKMMGKNNYSPFIAPLLSYLLCVIFIESVASFNKF